MRAGAAPSYHSNSGAWLVVEVSPRRPHLPPNPFTGSETEDLFTKACLIATAISTADHAVQSNIRSLVAQQNSKSDSNAFRDSIAVAAAFQAK